MDELYGGEHNFLYEADVFTLCEYILLENPQGLRAEDFVPEIFKRGMPDVRKQNLPIDMRDEKILRALTMLTMLDKDVYYITEKKDDGIALLNVSAITLDVLSFCTEYMRFSQDILTYSYNQQHDLLDIALGDGHIGNILQIFDKSSEPDQEILSSDLNYRIFGGRFSFEPGSAKTPMAFSNNINLLEVGEYLARYDVWLNPKPDKQFSNIKNVYFSIANFYWNKFKKPFYEIYGQAREYYESEGYDAEPLEDRLREIVVPN